MQIYTTLVNGKRFEGFNKIPNSKNSFEEAKKYFGYFKMSNHEKTLRNSCRQEALKDLSLVLAHYMFEDGWFQSCLNCSNWDDRQEMCIKYKQRPPAKVIVTGCSEHSDIPF